MEGGGEAGGGQRKEVFRASSEKSTEITDTNKLEAQITKAELLYHQALLDFKMLVSSYKTEDIKRGEEELRDLEREIKLQSIQIEELKELLESRLVVEKPR